MGEHICNRCGWKFNRKFNLTQHLTNRKTPCNSSSRWETSYQTEASKVSDEDSQRFARKRRFSFDDKNISPIQDNKIPTFAGDEFSGKKSKSRETIYKMMEMMKIPEHRQDKIAVEILKHDRNQIVRPESNTNQKDFSKFIDESGEDGEGSLTESELDETIEDFEKLYSELIYKGRRENINELMVIFNVWREAGEITQADYMKITNKIKSYL